MTGHNAPPPADGAVLAAFREVTGWSDALVLHYAVCESYCTPICGAEEMDCPEARRLNPP